MPLQSWAELIKQAEAEGSTGGGFTPLPAASYDFVIEKSDYKPAGNGKDGYWIQASVETGPHTGRKVFNTFYVSPESPRAMSIFFRQMGALGLDSTFWAGEPTKEQIVQALVGRRFYGKVAISANRPDQNDLKDVSAPRAASAAATPSGAGPVPGGLPTAAPAPAPSFPQAAPAPGPAPVPVTQTAPQAPAYAPPAPAPAPAPVAPPQAAPQAPAYAPQAPQAAPQQQPAQPQGEDPWATNLPPVPPLPGGF